MLSRLDEKKHLLFPVECNDADNVESIDDNLEWYSAKILSSATKKEKKSEKTSQIAYLE